MALIGSLVISLKSDISGFSKGLKKGHDQVNAFAKSIKGTLSSVTGLGSALTVSGFVLWTKSTMDSIDATAKLSDRLGIATEAVVAFKHAANLAGVSQENLETSLSRLTRVIGEVRGGSKTYNDALKRLNISTAEFMRLDTAAAYELVAKRINELPTAADRANVAVDIFGKGGIALINLFAEDLKKARESTERFGSSFSRIDARAVEKANDSVTNLWESIKGLGTTTAIEFGPAIASTTDALTNQVALIGQSIKVITKWKLELQDVGHIMKTVSNMPVVGWLIGKMSGAPAGFGNAVGSMLQPPTTPAQPPPAILDFSSFGKLGKDLFSTSDMKAATDIFTRSMNAFGKAFDIKTDIAEFNREIEKGIATLGMSADRVRLWEMQQRKLPAGIFETTKRLIEQREALEKSRTATEEVARIFEETRLPVERFQEQLAHLEELRSSGKLDEETFSRAKRKLENNLLSQSGFGGPVQLPQAALAGSSEAISAINRFQAQGAAMNPQNRMVDLLKQQSDQNQQQINELKQLREELRRGGQVVKF